jgi:branched-chain amino acid transport system substrate-binding protein
MLFHKKNVVFSLYVIILTIVCPVIFWTISHQDRDSSKAQSSLEETQSASDSQEKQDKSPQQSNSKWLSAGDKNLIAADSNADKQAGIEAYGAGDFATATAKFKSSLATNRNDPETWIYLNNASAIASGDFVKIAVSVPIGGNLNVAKEILRGVAQAQHEINQSGGVGGNLVLVEIANDNNDPEIGKQIASELVNDSQVLGVVGHNDSNVTMAAASVYQQGGLVAISPTSVASNLSGIGNYIFRTTTSTRVLADTLARHAVESAHKSKIAICSDSRAAASTSFKEELTIAVFDRGGKVTNTACDFANPNFNPDEIPSLAIGDGADAIVLAPSIDRVRRALEVARANQGRLTILGSQAMYVFETLKEGQGDTNGAILSVVWHPDAVSETLFSTNAKKMWGGSGSWRTATAYDATEAILIGLKSGQNREKLQKTLSDPNFSLEGATGDVRFQPSGDRIAKGVLVKVQPGKASGTGYDFVPLK